MMLRRHTDIIIFAVISWYSTALVDGYTIAPTHQRNRGRIGSIACINCSRRRIIDNSPQFRYARNAVSNENDDEERTYGGYTTKQRLREEVESPFRTVRLFFFGASTVSALLALYFSITTAALIQTTATPASATATSTMDDAIQSCIVNVCAVLICGAITYRDWMAGNANLERIARGSALAKLAVAQQTQTTTSTTIPNPNVATTTSSTKQILRTLAEYRRKLRVIICVGGTDYIHTLCRTLNSDQKRDINTLPSSLEASDVILVPVVLSSNSAGTISASDSKEVWMSTMPNETIDRNYNVNRAMSVVAFPRGLSQWNEYLQNEIQTCQAQGYDVLSTGFTITVKKNGRILRRATGQPQLTSFLERVEILDGSKFGMPGDDEKYYNV